MNIVQIFNILITQPIFNGLMILYHLFGDFGLSIVVLTLIIKLLLFPLTVKQLKSMKATQALQPKMTEIRQKYKNDQQAQMQAMQALYKEHGVNPASGCLPLLVQLPVLYGLFFALENGLGKATETPQQMLHTVNSQLYSFVPHFTTPPDIALRWFTFLNPHWYILLNQPDHSHILPILAGIATFVQLRMSQARQVGNAPANDPTTQSMKMMQYVMPLVTVFIGWSFAAGLALYWTVSYIFQAVQQYFITGWGSLTVLPNIKQEASTGTNKKKNTTRIVEGSTVTNKVAGNGSQNGKTASQSRTSTLPASESE
ncbi:MAG TPA: YidC/Oxa1 family membrane protein insertase, partial [Ktedonobacteraceae bacterium]